MNLILDTSVLIEIERGNKKVVERLNELRNLYPAQPKISFMTYFEFLYGLRKRNVKNKEMSRGFLNLFEVIHTTSKTADFLVLLKDKYELPLADLFIASQVMENAGILVTRDKDFGKIKETEKIFV
ncbi:MAG: type II toxin-antitoxin system VapC family toxin [Candidatus Pacearchaeota archaeon]|nr:type II toxin-antitoxin system VapC family toxin [Candidatus Pacearchaeota archaeon]